MVATDADCYGLFIVFSFITVYSYVAVIEGNYGFTAIRKIIEACFALPANTIIYALLRLGSLFLIYLATFVASVIGIHLSCIMTILLSLVIAPVFHIFKTMFFLNSKLSPEMLPIPLGPPISSDVFIRVLKTGVNKIKIGPRELINFYSGLRNIPFHILFE